jgi:hypothetical protein
MAPENNNEQPELPMTSPYRHRLARTFHRLARQHPDLPLRQLFRLCHHQMLEQQIAELLEEIHELSTRYHINVTCQSPQAGARQAYRRRTEQHINGLITQVAALTRRQDRLQQRPPQETADGYQLPSGSAPSSPRAQYGDRADRSRGA